mmetsp:Transcript_2937/g.11897  ORF Transcript_2937/g.11897 Transcript_2937/m.11897 type:complete len:204 (+) Transcript_2937:1121-1732(+)
MLPTPRATRALRERTPTRAPWTRGRGSSSRRATLRTSRTCAGRSSSRTRRERPRKLGSRPRSARRSAESAKVSCSPACWVVAQLCAFTQSLTLLPRAFSPCRGEGSQRGPQQAPAEVHLFLREPGNEGAAGPRPGPSRLSPRHGAAVESLVHRGLKFRDTKVYFPVGHVKQKIHRCGSCSCVVLALERAGFLIRTLCNVVHCA